MKNPYLRLFLVRHFSKSERALVYELYLKGQLTTNQIRACIPFFKYDKGAIDIVVTKAGVDVWISILMTFLVTGSLVPIGALLMISPKVTILYKFLGLLMLVVWVAYGRWSLDPLHKRNTAKKCK